LKEASECLPKVRKLTLDSAVWSPGWILQEICLLVRFASLEQLAIGVALDQGHGYSKASWPEDEPVIRGSMPSVKELVISKLSLKDMDISLPNFLSSFPTLERFTIGRFDDPRPKQITNDQFHQFLLHQSDSLQFLCIEAGDSSIDAHNQDVGYERWDYNFLCFDRLKLPSLTSLKEIEIDWLHLGIPLITSTPNLEKLDIYFEISEDFWPGKHEVKRLRGFFTELAQTEGLKLQEVLASFSFKHERLRASNDRKKSYDNEFATSIQDNSVAQYEAWRDAYYEDWDGEADAERFESFDVASFDDFFHTMMDMKILIGANNIALHIPDGESISMKLKFFQGIAIDLIRTRKCSTYY